MKAQYKMKLIHEIMESLILQIHLIRNKLIILKMRFKTQMKHHRVQNQTTVKTKIKQVAN